MNDSQYEIGNAAFQDYATSGAFNVSLSKRQVSSLAMAAGGGMRGGFGYDAALIRKGLLTPVQGRAGYVPLGSGDPAPVEYRLTTAGVHIASLCRIAGLTQGDVDVAGAEIASLHADLAAARASEREALLDQRSLMARLQAAEQTITDLEFARDHGWPGHQPQLVRLRYRDPRPDRPTAAIAERLAEATEGMGK